MRYHIIVIHRWVQKGLLSSRKFRIFTELFVVLLCGVTCGCFVIFFFVIMTSSCYICGKFWYVCASPCNTCCVGLSVPAFPSIFSLERSYIFLFPSSQYAQFSFKMLHPSYLYTCLWLVWQKLSNCGSCQPHCSSGRTLYFVNSNFSLYIINSVSTIILMT